MFGRRGMGDEQAENLNLGLQPVAHEKKSNNTKGEKLAGANAHAATAHADLQSQLNKLTPQSAPAHKQENAAEKHAREKFKADKERIHKNLMDQIDLATASKLPPDNLRRQIMDLIHEIAIAEKLTLNQSEQQQLATEIIDDMLGLGPLEPLLKDPLITDIMVNGANQVYLEKKGKLQLSDIKFRDEAQVNAIAQRIVNAVGRRVDESSPICDARLPDGSRVYAHSGPTASCAGGWTSA